MQCVIFSSSLIHVFMFWHNLTFHFLLECAVHLSAEMPFLVVSIFSAGLSVVGKGVCLFFKTRKSQCSASIYEIKVSKDFGESLQWPC